VHQRPLQPVSQLVISTLHQSPPSAPPAQTEVAPVPSLPQLQKPIPLPIVEGGEDGGSRLSVHQRPLQPVSQLVISALHQPPTSAPPAQTEVAAVPSLPQLQKPIPLPILEGGEDGGSGVEGGEGGGSGVGEGEEGRSVEVTPSNWTSFML
jgi:hypothetical protein